MTSASRSTPTLFFQERRPLAAYALPHKRERGRTAPVSSTSLSRMRKSACSELPSSLSRLRGRVARPSGRDGWGLARPQTHAEAA
jgi:hypothetical protein